MSITTGRMSARFKVLDGARSAENKTIKMSSKKIPTMHQSAISLIYEYILNITDMIHLQSISFEFYVCAIDTMSKTTHFTYSHTAYDNIKYFRTMLSFSYQDPTLALMTLHLMANDFSIYKFELPKNMPKKVIYFDNPDRPATCIPQMSISGQNGIESVRFRNMPKCIKIDDYVLRESPNITSIDFGGLYRVKTIGKNFMEKLNHYIRTDSFVFPSLISVGDNFMAQTKLINFDTAKLSPRGLKTIGTYFFIRS
jgi:hypothetical protein